MQKWKQKFSSLLAITMLVATCPVLAAETPAEVFPNPAVTDTTPANSGIVPGAQVMVRSGATTYAGNRLGRFVYDTVYLVESVSGDRALLQRDGVVRAAVHVNDLILLAAPEQTPVPETPVETPAPETPPVSDSGFIPGMAVMVREGATTYAGGRLIPATYITVYTIESVSGDRARIAQNGEFRAAINVKDLIPVSGAPEEAPAPEVPETPAPEAPTDPSIVPGMRVMVREGATTYNGIRLIPSTYETVYVVQSVSGDHVWLERDGVFKLGVRASDLIPQ